MILAIFLNSLAIGFYNYNDFENENDSLNKKIDKANLAFTIFFTVEAIIKIMTFGILMGSKNAYLKIGWNYLDLSIIITG